MRRAATLFLLCVGLVVSRPSAADDSTLASLTAGRYAELDAALNHLQDEYTRGTASDEQLLAAFRPFYALDAAQERALDDWVRAFPTSYAARLARGIHYKQAGLAPVIGDDVEFVTEARTIARRAAFARAREDLTASLSLAAKPLLSYHHQIEARGSIAWFRTNEMLLDDAVKLDPGNVVVRRKFLTTLAPRNGGSLAKMQAFVREQREAGVAAPVIAKLEHTLAVERAVVAFPRVGDYAAVLPDYERLQAEDPDDTRITELRLGALEKLKRCDDAIALATRWIDDDPRYAAYAFDVRGRCRQQTDPAGAARDFTAAADLGNTWALKELARRYWQGKDVPRDRAMALTLLRRAARTGDREAVQEYELRTGERVRTWRPAWYALLPGIPVALLLCGAGGFVMWRRGRESDAIRARRLEHEPRGYLGRAATLSFFAGLLASKWLYPGLIDRDYLFWLFLVITLAALPGVFGYLFVRHDVDETGLTYRRWWGRRLRVNWTDVRRISRPRFRSAFEIEAVAGPVIRVSDTLRHLGVFADLALEHVPPGRIEAPAVTLLEALRVYVGCEEWSAADIQAQRDAAPSRRVMNAASDSASFGLAVVDALPASGIPDPDALEARHAMIAFVEFESPGMTLHLYVDTPVPDGVLRYSLPRARRDLTLQVTGALAFGGAESLTHAAVADGAARTDVALPAGDYAAEILPMSFPRSMLAAATGSWRMQGASIARLLLFSIIGLIALFAAAFVASGAWLLAAGFAAVVVIAVVAYRRSTWRRRFHERMRRGLDDFPHVVVRLRRRVGDL